MNHIFPNAHRQNKLPRPNTITSISLPFAMVLIYRKHRQPLTPRQRRLQQVQCAVKLRGIKAIAHDAQRSALRLVYAVAPSAYAFLLPFPLSSERLAQGTEPIKRDLSLAQKRSTSALIEVVPHPRVATIGDVSPDRANSRTKPGEEIRSR